MSHRPDTLKGMAAGVLAGLVAAYLMEQFQNAWLAHQSDDTASGGDAEEPATSKLADRGSRALLGRPLSHRAKQTADPVVHYTTGAVLGALYGFLAEDAPGITTGAGTVYAGVTAIGLDDGVVPLMGLGPSPEDTPSETHLYAFASHLVFGVAMEGARRLLRTI